jgi:hypothetical protein
MIYNKKVIENLMEEALYLDDGSYELLTEALEKIEDYNYTQGEF